MGSPGKHLKQECGVLIQHFGLCSARRQVQGAYMLPLSLNPGPAIQYALEAAVTAVLQHSCPPVGQHPQASGRWMWSRGIFALLSLTKLSPEHRLWKPKPPNTAKINMIPQLNYLYPEMASKSLRIQREKWLWEGVQWHKHSKKSLYNNQQVHNHICHQRLYKCSNYNICII